MNVIGHGIDIIECQRIDAVWRRHGQRFLQRVFTPHEIDYCLAKRDPLPSLTGRFAAKEAVLKVIGTGWTGSIAWTDIEVSNDPAGQPTVKLAGHTAQIAKKLGIKRIALSISHTQNHATASAIGLSK